MSFTDELSKLTDECRKVIGESEYYTKGCIYAAERMLERAEKIRKGVYKYPVIRNREFFEPRPEEEARRITEYYSRTPSYGMTKYGIAPMLEWLRENHAAKRIGELEQLVKRFRERETPVDGTPGSYDRTAAEEALAAAERAASCEGDEYIKALVKAADKIYDCYNSRVLLSDIDPGSNLFMSSDEKDAMRERILQSDMYEEAARIAGYYTPEQTAMLEELMRMDIDYGRLNKHFYMWSTTDKVITFRTPENTRYASLSFLLTEEDTAAGGLGHVWLDNISVTSSDGGDWSINDPGFEAGAGWEPLRISGKQTVKRETAYPYCGSEKASVYIENISGCGGITHSGLIGARGDSGCTIIFDAKIDGKLRRGIKIIIGFYDADKNRIGEFVHFYNRKSVPRDKPFALTMQADAVMYFVTGDKTYAKKAREQMMYVLNDFCNGMETWFAYDLRPDGCDCYGAVQGGRIMCSLMSTYTFVKDTFSSEEYTRMAEMLEYMESYIYDDRPRFERGVYEVQSDASNWQTDMMCGIGFMAMAMPRSERTGIMLENVNYFLRSQLERNVGADGAWPESLRYHMAALSRFALYAKVLKKCTGEDWFKTTSLPKMFLYPAMVQTPAYAYKNNRIGTPNFGDHTVNAGEDFAVFGICRGDIAEIDAELGRLVYSAWTNAGMPRMGFSAENIFAADLLYGEKEGAVCGIPELASCAFEDVGIYVMRSGDDYCAVTAPKKYIGHGHYDAGSMIIYKGGVPVVVDPGIEGYFNYTKDWYVSSSAHSVVQFARSGGAKEQPDPFDICLEKTDYSALQGWNDVPRSVEAAEFVSDTEKDRLTIRINDPEGRGVHIRELTLDKQKSEYTVCDRIEGYEGLFRWSLVTAMDEIFIDGGKIRCRSCFGTEAVIDILTPAESIAVETGRVTDIFPGAENSGAKIIRVTAKQKVAARIAFV